jgi:hypothetical protein
MSEQETQEWAWRQLDGYDVYGPFPTREEACHHARLALQGHAIKKIQVGQVQYANPVSCVLNDLDEHLERMDECACDNDFGWCEDQIFEVADHTAAQEALTAALEQWAERYVTSDQWCVSQTEEVDLGAEPAAQ